MPARGYEFFKIRIKFVSTSVHVIFCLLYKHTNDNDNGFDDLPKISEFFPKILQSCPKARRTFPNIFPIFPKITEDFRR